MSNHKIIAIEPVYADCDYSWDCHITYDYSNAMVFWCKNRGLEYGEDYHIRSFRIECKEFNSHYWYFKDPEVATLFALNFR